MKLKVFLGFLILFWIGNLNSSPESPKEIKTPETNWGAYETMMEVISHKHNTLYFHISYMAVRLL